MQNLSNNPIYNTTVGNIGKKSKSRTTKIRKKKPSDGYKLDQPYSKNSSKMIQRKAKTNSSYVNLNFEDLKNEQLTEAIRQLTG